jgi:septal ring factor EnvC (AmiA/AmiB activator)
MTRRPEVDMPTTHAPTDSELIRSLESEVRALRQRIEQREKALAQLNRRLLQLERDDIGASGRERAGFGNENDQLRREIAELHATKLFRWTASARTVYARARGSR